MARILYIDPGSTEILDEHFQRLLSDAASPDMEVDVRHLSVPGASPAPSYWAAGYELEGELFKRVRKAGEEGYDAVIIGCSADPGLDIARRISDIPVVAPLEANLHIASMLANRILIITPASWQDVRWLEDRARLYGLAHKIARIRPVDTGRPDVFELGKRIAEEPEKVREILLECFGSVVSVPGQAADHIREAIEEEGVQAVYFSCTLFSGMLGPLSEEFGIPMLDPVLGALRAAEAVVRSIKHYQ